jgi:hypothetical protein
MVLKIAPHRASDVEGVTILRPADRASGPPAHEIMNLMR